MLNYMPLTPPTCSTPSVLSLIPCLLHCKQSKQTAITVEVQHQWLWEQPGWHMLPIRQVNTIRVAAAAWHQVHRLLAFVQLAKDSLSVMQASAMMVYLRLIYITQQPSCKSFCHVSFCCIADDTSHDSSSMWLHHCFPTLPSAWIIRPQQHTHHFLNPGQCVLVARPLTPR